MINQKIMQLLLLVALLQVIIIPVTAGTGGSTFKWIFRVKPGETYEYTLEACTKDGETGGQEKS